MPDRFSGGIITFVLDTYVGGMSKKNIKNLIQGIKVKIVYDGNYYGKKSEIIDFKNCNNIKLEKQQTICLKILKTNVFKLVKLI